MSAPASSAAMVGSTANGRLLLPTVLTEWLAKQGFPGLSSRDTNGETPLMRAASLGAGAMVIALLAYGAAPEAVNDDGNNALWFACLQGGTVNILWLIEAGTPIDHANDDDITCLMQAAVNGRLEILQILLAKGADAGLYAPDGRSALDISADLGLQLLRLACRVSGSSPESACLQLNA